MDDARKAGSSLGAVIECAASGVPAGWGAPVYAKLDGDLAAAMMGINAVKGVELGAGFAAARLTGEENADPMYPGNEGPRFGAHPPAGTAGGITTGPPRGGSEEGRDGQKGASTGRSRGAADHTK